MNNYYKHSYMYPAYQFYRNSPNPCPLPPPPKPAHPPKPAPPPKKKFNFIFQSHSFRQSGFLIYRICN